MDKQKQNKIKNWLYKKDIDNYAIENNKISFNFLAGKTRKLFLFYVKRLFGESDFYNYNSADKVEKHFYDGCVVEIHNY